MRSRETWDAVRLAAIALVASLGLASSAASAVAPLVHGDPPSVDRLPELPAPPVGPGHPLRGVARLLAGVGDVRDALPGLWCGTERATDDTEHEPTGRAYSVHAIYALPSDVADEFPSRAGTLQADAFQASALLERLYGRAIRFDIGNDCGPQYLDISVVRLPETAAALAYLTANVTSMIDRLAHDLRTAGFATHGMSVVTDTLPSYKKDYLVWLEGVTVAPGLCGAGAEFPDDRRAADNINDFGGQLAIVFRSGAGFCGSGTVRHEIGHNLGALQASAPNAFDGSHCNDAYEDTMCYPLAPQVSGGGYQDEFFDYRNDDYWDPPGGTLPRWTVNLSRFICPDAACNVTQSSTGPLRALASAIAGLLVSCPQGALVNAGSCPANTTTNTSGEVAVGAASPRLVARARRLQPGRWRLRLRLTGSGTVRVRVVCRRRGRRVRAYSHRLRAPASVRTLVRCDSRPEVSMT